MSPTDPLQSINTENTEADEVQELSRCVRDLVALSALYSLWRNQKPSEIVQSLADVLLSMLRVDLVYVQLNATRKVAPDVAIRADGRPDLDGCAQKIVRALAPYLNVNASSEPQVIPDPMESGTLESGTLRLICSGIGYAADRGIVAAASRQPHFPTEMDRFLCRFTANQAAVAIAHYELVDETLQKTQQVAILEERNRLAREIHDTLGQGLTGIAIQLQVADRSGDGDSADWRSSVKQARLLAEECLAEVRRSVRALRPSNLDGHNLANALNRSLEQLTRHVAIRSALQIHGAAYALPPDVENNLLRVGQEALTNALRHAQASEIKMTLTYKQSEVRLRVEDNGRGFDPALPGEGGFGLTGMRERAARIQASLTVDSRPSDGTAVEMIVPVAT